MIAASAKLPKAATIPFTSCRSGRRDIIRGAFLTPTNQCYYPRHRYTRQHPRCYNLGSWSESVIRPRDIDSYRRVTYWLGFWFSALLPFAIPALVAWSYIIHPGAAAVPEP